MWLWSYILIIIAGVLNAIMDKIQFHWDKSIFSKIKNPKLIKWCNPSNSHTNKWKNGNWYEGEKFLGSSTIFVWTTDLWHFAQFLMLSCFIGAVVLYDNFFSLWLILDFVILRVLFSGTFTVFFDGILSSKFWAKIKNLLKK